MDFNKLPRRFDTAGGDFAEGLAFGEKGQKRTQDDVPFLSIIIIVLVIILND